MNDQETLVSSTPVQTNKISIPAAIIVAGAFIAIAVFFTGAKSGNTEPTPVQPQSATAQQPAIPVDVSKVKTDEEPFIGDANAPVTIAYWFDYQCPFCERNEETVMPQIITNYVDTGKVKIVFKDFQFLGPDSQTLGVYARAVWAIAPDKFYDWHKAIFDGQGTENTGWATPDKILSITKSVLGAGDAAKVTQSITANGNAYQQQLDADKAEADTLEVNGTPAFIIGTQLVVGAQPYATFQQAITAALTNK